MARLNSLLEKTHDSYQGTPSGVPYKAEKLSGFSRGADGSTLRVAGKSFF
jgi:hypothetical protein